MMAIFVCLFFVSVTTAFSEISYLCASNVKHRIVTNCLTKEDSYFLLLYPFFRFRYIFVWIGASWTLILSLQIFFSISYRDSNYICQCK